MLACISFVVCHNRFRTDRSLHLFGHHGKRYVLCKISIKSTTDWLPWRLKLLTCQFSQFLVRVDVRIRSATRSAYFRRKLASEQLALGGVALTQMAMWLGFPASSSDWLTFLDRDADLLDDDLSSVEDGGLEGAHPLGCALLPGCLAAAYRLQSRI